MKKRNQHVNTSISSSINGFTSRATGGVVVSLDGIVAYYSPSSIDTKSNPFMPVWYDTAVGTRPYGKSSGAAYDNWTGIAVASAGIISGDCPPLFDGVDECCSTGQAVVGPSPSNPTGINYFYQEYGLHPAAMELATTGTVEAWVKPSGTGGARAALGYHHLFRLGSNGTKFTLYLYGVGFNDGPTITVNNWYHVAVTFTYGGTFDLWINGAKELSAQPFISSHTPGRAWFIGDIQNSAWPWGGQIDTARFYSRVLTDAEVVGNYNAEQGAHV